MHQCVLLVLCLSLAIISCDAQSDETAATTTRAPVTRSPRGEDDSFLFSGLSYEAYIGISVGIAVVCVIAGIYRWWTQKKEQEEQERAAREAASLGTANTAAVVTLGAPVHSFGQPHQHHQGTEVNSSHYNNNNNNNDSDNVPPPPVGNEWMNQFAPPAFGQPPSAATAPHGAYYGTAPPVGYQPNFASGPPPSPSTYPPPQSQPGMY